MWHARHGLLHAVRHGGLCNAEEIEKAGDAFDVLHDGVKTAGRGNAANQNHRQRHNHNHTLHEIRNAFGQKSAQKRIDDDKQRADDHHAVVGKAEQRAEQLAARYKTAGSIDGEKHKNKDGGNAHDYLFIFMKTVAEKVRNGDGVAGHGRIPAQALCNQQPVDIGAGSQADGGPGGVCQAAPIRYARQPHQQPAAHIRSFRAHGGNPGPQAAPADKVVFRILIGPLCKKQTDANDHQHIQDHGD